jgi:HEAT repeat protein
MRRLTTPVVFGLLFLAGGAAAQTDDDKAQVAEDEKLLRAGKVPADGPGLLQFFRDQVPTAAEQERIRGLAADLGHKTYRVREKAAADLVALGPRALPVLRRTAAEADLEPRRRAAKCIHAIEGKYGSELLQAAARLVAARRPPGACAVLLDYLPSARDGDVEEAVVGALGNLARPAGKVDPALAAALEDRAPARRAAAALVLGQLGDADRRAAVRRLLADPAPAVRFAAARGLLAARDAAALPALIALLADGPPELARQGEEILKEVAGKQAPAVALADDDAARKASGAAWQAWWREHKDRVSLEGLELGLSPSDPAALTRAVGRRFVSALAGRDYPALFRTVELPFCLAGFLTFKTPQEFENTFGKAVREGPPRKLAFTLQNVYRGQEFLRSADARMRPFLEGLPLSQVRVLYVLGQEPNGPGERAALIVRVRGARARVIGIADVGGRKNK